MEFDIEFIRRVTDRTRSAFEMRVYLDDDGLREEVDEDEELEKNLLGDEDADSDEYSDSSEGAGDMLHAEEDDEPDEDSDSFEGDIDGSEFAKYDFGGK